METVGSHSSVLPNFVESGVLKRNSCGEVEYDFGPEAHFVSLCDLQNIKQKKSKHQLDDTPQHGARRKRPLTVINPKVKIKTSIKQIDFFQFVCMLYSNAVIFVSWFWDSFFHDKLNSSKRLKM